MVSFNYKQEALQHNLDHEILRNSPISLYHNHQYFEADVAWFQEHGYEVQLFDMVTIKIITNLMLELQKRLLVPNLATNLAPTNLPSFDVAQIGLDAFADYFSDTIEKYQESKHTGLLIAIKNIEVLHRLDKQFTLDLLSILAASAHNFMIYGIRLITIVQSTDQDLKFDDSVTKNLIINSREFFER